MTYTIEALHGPPSPADLAALTDLLVDTVDGGGSVSFMAPLSRDDAEAFWKKTIATLSVRGAILVARDGSGIVGSVQLHPAWAPNQPHRGDIAKLLVHRRARRRGIARALMDAVEAEARELGLTMLVLDTVRGGAADTLYRELGWTVVGVIPDYALDPYGTMCDTVVFFKRP
jgi:ribosomal protein S18 acetylase RimI-like enzyme